MPLVLSQGEEKKVVMPLIGQSQETRLENLDVGPNVHAEVLCMSSTRRSVAMILRYLYRSGLCVVIAAAMFVSWSAAAPGMLGSGDGIIRGGCSCSGVKHINCTGKTGTSGCTGSVDRCAEPGTRTCTDEGGEEACTHDDCVRSYYDDKCE